MSMKKPKESDIDLVDRFVFQVKSRSEKGIVRTVDLMEGKYGECDCPHFIYNPDVEKCWHIDVCRDWMMQHLLDRAKEEEKQLRKKSSIPYNGISNMSPSMRAKMNEYATLRKLFLKHNPYCRVTNTPADDIHHSRGRVGDLLLDTRYWIPVCRRVHEQIHRDIEWARQFDLISHWSQPGPEIDINCHVCDEFTNEARSINGLCLNCAKSQNRIKL